MYSFDVETIGYPNLTSIEPVDNWFDLDLKT